MPVTGLPCAIAGAASDDEIGKLAVVSPHPVSGRALGTGGPISSSASCYQSEPFRDLRDAIEPMNRIAVTAAAFEEVAKAALAHAVGDETERAYRRGDALGLVGFEVQLKAPVAGPPRWC